MKGKKNMTNISDRKIFYTSVLKDRFPIATITFPLESTPCNINFYSTPLGIILKARLEKNSKISAIKLYDKKRANFEKQRLFISDDLVELDDGSLAAITQRLKIEDIIGRDFLIKIDDSSIVARAQMIFKPHVDKRAKLVYN